MTLNQQATSSLTTKHGKEVDGDASWLEKIREEDVLEEVKGQGREFSVDDLCGQVAGPSCRPV